MSRYLLGIGLMLAALAVGMVLLQQRTQPKPTAASALAPSAPALRGKPVSNFELPNLQGAKIHFTDFKGKVVLVNFWATWCPPCLEEIPWFLEFQKKYESQGLQIVGISMDETGAKDVAPFVKKHAMTYPVLLGDENVAGQFGGVMGLPTTFLVDQNGKYYSMYRGLVSRNTIEKELQALLSKTNPGATTPASSAPAESTPQHFPLAAPSKS